MSNDQRHHGVLLGRPDGVIVLADAIPWPTEVQRQLDHVLDTLGAPRTQPHAEQHNTPTGRPDD